MRDGRWQTVAWALAAIVAVVVGSRLLDGTPAPPPVRVGAEDPAAAGSAAQRTAPGGGDGRRRPAPTDPYVHVAGAVRRPGLYRLPTGSRVAAAVRRAGGRTAGADLDLINLAAVLQDGQQVVVPRRVAAGASAGGATGTPEAPVSLGNATAEQLAGVDGIGPTLAERIVAARQERGGFASLDQLAEVDGIGEKRLETLKAALTP